MAAGEGRRYAPFDQIGQGDQRPRNSASRYRTRQDGRAEHRPPQKPARAHPNRDKGRWLAKALCSRLKTALKISWCTKKSKYMPLHRTPSMPGKRKACARRHRRCGPCRARLRAHGRNALCSPPVWLAGRRPVSESGYQCRRAINNEHEAVFLVEAPAVGPMRDAGRVVRNRLPFHGNKRGILHLGPVFFVAIREQCRQVPFDRFRRKTPVSPHYVIFR